MAVHRAIVFDEIDEGQALANKLVLQAGPWPVLLSQSVCNQHSYSKWFYGCAMILQQHLPHECTQWPL
jgi:hypothetical protein